ncbi:MAG: galactose oxidase-like domain-containing protein [Planctomycetota bacterium]
MPPRRVAWSTLVAVCLSGAAVAQAAPLGSWAAPFDHEVNTANTNQLAIPITHLWPPRFNAIHMALVPVGPHRGRVLVWDKAEVALRPYQRWSIVDPTWAPGCGRPRFRNFFLSMPQAAQTGDLFCAGHAWLRDGRLFVAGGTALYPLGPQGYFGAALCYQFAPDVYDPANGDHGSWYREPDLATTRWYPTVTVNADDSVTIAGGSDNGAYHGDYEQYRRSGVGASWGQSPPPPMVFDQRTQGGGNPRVYAGPPAPSGFGDYPRLHLLSSGELFCSGWFRRGVKWRHTPDQQPVYDFSAGDGSTSPTVSYASSILDPRQGGGDDRILRIGGSSFGISRYDVDHVQASVPGPWQSYGAPFRLNHVRWMQNAVILPDAKVFVVGGFDDGQNPGHPTLTPELLAPQGWVDVPPHTGARGYHSCAVLLPDGRVFVGGADTRSFDYQIYSPPYLTNGLPRPTGIGCSTGPVPGGLRYRADAPDDVHTLHWDEGLPPGVVVDKVVLLRPGSLTHHSDMDMRYLRLPVLKDDDVDPARCRLRFQGPKDSAEAPRGWYMLFAVTNQGVPGEALWVHVE